MVESRCDHRLPLVALISRSTSAVVRYSRVRRSALGRRVGVTVCFSGAGVISRRCDLAKVFAFLRRASVRTMGIFRTALPLAGRAVPGAPHSNGARPTSSPGGAWTGGGSRARRDVCRKYLGAIFGSVDEVLTS